MDRILFQWEQCPPLLPFLKQDLKTFWRSLFQQPTAPVALNPASPTPRPTPAQAQERKLRLADKLDQQLLDVESNGYVLVFTDGSAKRVDGVGSVAGYGVYVSGTTTLSAFFLVALQQSNNIAELQANVRALHICNFRR